MALLVLAGCSSKNETENGIAIEFVGGSLELGGTAEIMVDLGEAKVEEDAWLGFVPASLARGASEVEADAVDVSYVYLNTEVEGVISLGLPFEEGEYDLRLYNTDSGENGYEMAAISLDELKFDKVYDFGIAFGGGSSGDLNANNDGDNSVDATDEDKDDDGKMSPEACLEGSWKMNNFSEYLTATVEQNLPDTGGVIDLSVSATDSGDLILNFDNGVMTMTDNNFVVEMTIMGITTPVEIDADGVNEYVVDGNVISGGTADVDVDGMAAGQTYTFSQRNLLSGSVEFTCGDDSLVWLQNESFPVDLVFSRIN